MVEFLCVRRWEKINNTDFYWQVVKMSLNSLQYGGII